VFSLSLSYISPPWNTHTSKATTQKSLEFSLSLLVQSAFIYSLTVYPVAHSQSHVRAPGQIYIDVYVAGITNAPSGAHTYLNTFVTVRSNMTCIAPSLSTQNTHTEEKEPPQKKKTRTLIYKGSFLMASRPALSNYLPRCGSVAKRNLPRENETKHRSSTACVHGTHQLGQQYI
jgi:hypothetical protein